MSFVYIAHESQQNKCSHIAKWVRPLNLIAHPLACCGMLLRVVAKSLKTVKLLSQQLPTFLFFHNRRGVAQQCWIRLHSFSNIAGALKHDYYTWSPWSLQSLMGCIFPTMHFRSNTVGSCCISVDTTANTDATTPNIVGLLWVVDVH